MAKLSRALPLAAALMLGAAPAFAQSMDQVTDEQQEACAPDAVRLCQDTIPDVGRTKACMSRHIAELTPRCRTVFNEATGGGAIEPRERISRPDLDDDDAPRIERRAARIAPEADDDYGPPSYEYLTPDGDPAATGGRRRGYGEDR